MASSAPLAKCPTLQRSKVVCSTFSGSLGQVFAQSCALCWAHISGRRRLPRDSWLQPRAGESWLQPRAGQAHCRSALACCSVNAHLQPTKYPLQNRFQQSSRRQPLSQWCKGLPATSAAQASHPVPPGTLCNHPAPCKPQWFTPKVAPGVHQPGAGQPWPHRESVRVHVAWCGLGSWLHGPPGLHTHHGHRLRTGVLGTCGSALAPCCPPSSPAGARQSSISGSWLLGRLLIAAPVRLRVDCSVTLLCLLQAAKR